MRMTLYTWDSHSLQDTSYIATEPIGVSNGMSPATPTYIDMGSGDPVLGGKTLAGTLFTFQIRCLGTTDATLESQRDTLRSWFRPNDFTIRQLVGHNIDDSNSAWYLEGYPVTGPVLQEGAVKNLFNVTLALKTPYWIKSTPDTNTWSITADTETEVMTNTGNIAALPKFVITPKQAKGSNALNYKSFYAIYHDAAYNQAANGLAYDITDGGLDTATLVTASKMQADGDDVGVMVDGVYVNRWFGTGAAAMNTAATKIWINISLDNSPTMLLKVALPNNGSVPASLLTTYTEDSYVSRLKNNSALLIGNEIITYSTFTVDASTKTITFIPTLRAAKNSSYAAHNVSDPVYWIQHDIWLTYGNSTMTARAVDDTKKPTINLETSTNTEWIYANFLTGLNGASWGRYGMLYGSLYTGVHGTNDAAFPVLGIKLESRLVGNIVISDTTSDIYWRIYHPGEITKFTATGEIYRTGTTWGTYTIMTQDQWTILSTISSPSVINTWEPFTLTDVPTYVGPNSIIFRFYGGLGAAFPAPTAYVELSTLNITVTYPLKVKALGVEQANYLLSGSLLNNTTGHSIIFNNVIGKINEAITIDCATQEVYGADGKRIRSMIQFGGAKRDEWITLIGGANSIIFTDIGTVEVLIVTTWSSKGTI